MRPLAFVVMLLFGFGDWLAHLLTRRRAAAVLLALLAVPAAAQIPRPGPGQSLGIFGLRGFLETASFPRLVTVAPDGSGDYTTVGAAMAALAADPAPAVEGFSPQSIVWVLPGVYYEEPFSIPANTSLTCVPAGSPMAIASGLTGILFKTAGAGTMISLGRNSHITGCDIQHLSGVLAPINLNNALTGEVVVVSNATAAAPSYNTITSSNISYTTFGGNATNIPLAAVEAGGGATSYMVLVSSRLRNSQSAPGNDSPLVRVSGGNLETWGSRLLSQPAPNNPSHGVLVETGTARLYDTAVQTTAYLPGGASVADLAGGSGAVYAWGGTCGLVTSGEVWRMDDLCADPWSLAIADSGDGAAAAGAILDRGQLVTRVDCQDADGCDLTFPDSGREREMAVVNTSANAVTITDAAGVVETIGASAVLTAANSSASFRRVGGAWIQTRAVAAP